MVYLKLILVTRRLLSLELMAKLDLTIHRKRIRLINKKSNVPVFDTLTSKKPRKCLRSKDFEVFVFLKNCVTFLFFCLFDNFIHLARGDDLKVGTETKLFMQ